MSNTKEMDQPVMASEEILERIRDVAVEVAGMKRAQISLDEEELRLKQQYRDYHFARKYMDELCRNHLEAAERLLNQFFQQEENEDYYALSNEYVMMKKTELSAIQYDILRLLDAVDELSGIVKKSLREKSMSVENVLSAVVRNSNLADEVFNRLLNANAAEYMV